MWVQDLGDDSEEIGIDNMILEVSALIWLPPSRYPHREILINISEPLHYKLFDWCLVESGHKFSSAQLNALLHVLA
ncbi:hypothetical protein LENED_011281 [Lentinula edodes]|uniref:Uncharacterized protein n=1 Tax=Lentinula edodes TaxID=5353 RepID=A0A1Q3EPM2_LENED|nr:hypothetical protein LENED_011281 [Lentinula edodes]